MENVMDMTTLRLEHAPTGEKYLINRDMQRLLPTKKVGGHIDWVDPNIMIFFGNEIFLDDSLIEGDLNPIAHTISYERIIKKMSDEKRFKTYPIGAALILLHSCLKNVCIVTPTTRITFLVTKAQENSLYTLGLYSVHKEIIGLETGPLRMKDELKAGDMIVY